MGDIGEVWNIAKDTASLFASGHSQAMGSRACACPRDVQPSQLDWTNGQEHTIQQTMNWSNYAKEYFNLSTGTSLRIGATWTFGGTSQQHSGLYLHDAYLWAVLDHSSLGSDVTVTGGFGDAVPMGNSAELSGWIRVNVSCFHIHVSEHQFDIRLRGNGYGVMKIV
jgi:hypothetical protein